MQRRFLMVLVSLLITACAEVPDDNPSRGDESEERCGDLPRWPDAWAAFEEEVFERVNAVRAAGYNCRSKGNFGPAPALIPDTTLRCSARLHSVDMVERNFFAHQNPDGQSPTDRMVAAGFGNWRFTGENIAGGQESPQEVMEAWLGSDGHCRNILDPDFVRLGVGYYFGEGSLYGDYWTQNFGTLFSD